MFDYIGNAGNFLVSKKVAKLKKGGQRGLVSVRHGWRRLRRKNPAYLKRYAG